jgi:hypothetical protein
MIAPFYCLPGPFRAGIPAVGIEEPRFDFGAPKGLPTAFKPSGIGVPVFGLLVRGMVWLPHKMTPPSRAAS